MKAALTGFIVTFFIVIINFNKIDSKNSTCLQPGSKCQSPRECCAAMLGIPVLCVESKCLAPSKQKIAQLNKTMHEKKCKGLGYACRKNQDCCSFVIPTICSNSSDCIISDKIPMNNPEGAVCGDPGGYPQMKNPLFLG